MMREINVDQNWDQLGLQRVTKQSSVIPRQSRYGAAPEHIPFGEAYPELLVDPRDYKEVIQHCHDEKIFPMYHEKEAWRKDGYRWNQNGLGYCWTWGLTGQIMTCRELEGKEHVLLSPVTLGWLVNWRNEGNYLDSAVRGARERGIAPMSYTPDQHSTNYRGYQAGWEDAALGFRLGDTWDTPDNASVKTRIQYLVSILASAVGNYVAWYWWGHATGVSGLIWDESAPNNIKTVVSNSHNEDDFLIMKGDRAIPNEMIGICSTLT